MNSMQKKFPVGLSAKWQTSPPSTLNSYLVDWLLEPSSLTVRLKQHCQTFKLEVLGQQVIACPEDESFANIQAGNPVLVREVLLYCDNQPQVFARSLLPISSLTGEQAQLANLGTQPLGQIIFNEPSLERKCIKVAQFNTTSKMATLSHQLSLPVEHSLWGRRSLFYLKNKPLMVAEVFLPNAYAYSKGL
jgi:chorismate--pyruvate lyase